MRKFRINNLPELKSIRRKLRNNATPVETVLWRYLMKRRLEGRKFRRQHSIGNYVVDFYWPAESLVIELDGKYHFTEKGIKLDNKKTAFLNSFGIRVLRLENKKVFEDIEAVLGTIRLQFIDYDATKRPQ